MDIEQRNRRQCLKQMLNRFATDSRQQKLFDDGIDNMPDEIVEEERSKLNELDAQLSDANQEALEIIRYFEQKRTLDLLVSALDGALPHLKSSVKQVASVANVVPDHRKIGRYLRQMVDHHYTGFKRLYDYSPCLADAIGAKLSESTVYIITLKEIEPKIINDLSDVLFKNVSSVLSDKIDFGNMLACQYYDVPSFCDGYRHRFPVEDVCRFYANPCANQVLPKTDLVSADYGSRKNIRIRFMQSSGEMVRATISHQGILFRFMRFSDKVVKATISHQEARNAITVNGMVVNEGDAHERRFPEVSLHPVVKKGINVQPSINRATDCLRTSLSITNFSAIPD